MAKISPNISVAELEANAGRVVRRVRRSRKPLLLAERGQTQAVMLSVEAFERGERERAILKEIARGEREIASGHGLSLERVLADADKVLTRARK